jgi:hypothetical protein
VLLVVLGFHIRRRWEPLHDAGPRLTVRRIDGAFWAGLCFVVPVTSIDAAEPPAVETVAVDE